MGKIFPKDLIVYFGLCSSFLTFNLSESCKSKDNREMCYDDNFKDFLTQISLTDNIITVYFIFEQNSLVIQQPSCVETGETFCCVRHLIIYGGHGLGRFVVKNKEIEMINTWLRWYLQSWTLFSLIFSPDRDSLTTSVCLFVCLSVRNRFLKKLRWLTKPLPLQIFYCPCYGWARPQLILLWGRRLDWHLYL